ncbi:MAG: metal-dependent hydrolase [Campylobacteraceae bacterium]|nr:metal-dependent hydrolase [Campylobacteraceae bacterium]
MTLLHVAFALPCTKPFSCVEDAAIVFDEKIIDFGNFIKMRDRYPNALNIHAGKDSVLMPGLINPHVHLEFSANQGLLEFGGFIPWLNSVIANREDLQDAVNSEVITKALDEMLLSGTTAIGAISSFGLDLDACKKTPLHVTYFTELLGSRPDAVDILFEEFKQRLRQVFDAKDVKFSPAISIHSPYSTHPILAKNALDIARKEDLNVSTHFMESMAERAWLDGGTGDFATFFKAFSPHAAPFCNGFRFLSLFEKNHTLFTHAVHANSKELKQIKDMGAEITHCPVSNRMLGCGRLDLEQIKEFDINLSLGTDGLSSNRTLSLWEEMRAALMMHEALPLNSLAEDLFFAATAGGGKALRLNEGSLEVGKDATFLLLNLPGSSIKNLPLHAILHTNKPKSIYIQGERFDN